VILLGCLLISASRGQLKLYTAPDRVEIIQAGQKIVFVKQKPNSAYCEMGAHLPENECRKHSQNKMGTNNKNHNPICKVDTDIPEAFTLFTYVRKGSSWIPFFDAPQPIVQGQHFGQQPTTYTVERNDGIAKRVRFQQGADWILIVEAQADQPFISFFWRLTVRQPLELTGSEPDVAFWMHTPPEISLDQGPESLAGDGLAFTFPAAYCWKKGMEAAVFFDVSDPRTIVNTVGRFERCRIQTYTKTFSGTPLMGLGLNTFKSRSTSVHDGVVKNGTWVLRWYLYQNVHPRRPSKIEARDRLIQIFAPLHPGMGKFPPTRRVEGPCVAGNTQTSWETYARISICQLMQKEMVTNWTFSWFDPPLNLLNKMTPTTFPTHNGDYSINFNLLTPWILYARLHPQESACYEFALRQKEGLPLYYYEKARLIAFAPMLDPNTAPIPPLMSWQDLWFHIDMLRINDVLGAEHFNPAIVGRVLMGLEGLIDLAHRVDYCLPQWFDGISKDPLPQNDQPQLGTVREPWQVGSYIYLMTRAYRITGDKRYLDEACHSADTLFETMHFSVTDRKLPPYRIDYHEIGEFPVTEPHGLGFGMLGTYHLFEITGREKYRTYSRYFLDTLLTLTTWYEDNADEIARALPDLGLFKPGGGARQACPWEQAISNITMAALLGWNENLDASPYTLLLLKLLNLNRTNGFSWYSPAWPDFVSEYNKRVAERSPINYMPIEPLYAYETPWMPWAPAIYKPLAHWNYWLYEALVEIEPRDHALIVNLDTQESQEHALAGILQHFIVYNPSTTAQRTTLKFKVLRKGTYQCTMQSAKGAVCQQVYPSNALTEGITLVLAPGEYRRLTLRHEQADKYITAITTWRQAQYRLAYAYKLLQEIALDHPSLVPSLQDLKQQFQTALRHYNRRDYHLAEQTANKVVQTVKKIRANPTRK